MMSTHDTDEAVSDHVVTYQLAYAPGRVSLCDEHAQDPPHALGRVSHGYHSGICAVCERLREEARERRIAETRAAEEARRIGRRPVGGS